MRWTLTPLLCSLVLASATAAQAQCASGSCAGWGDINLLSATCDGTVSDQSSLQDAFCCLGSLGGTLVFPHNGVCTHREEISISNGANFNIEGNGATLKNFGDTPRHIAGYGGIRIEKSRNFTIRNLTLDGNREERLENSPPPPPDVDRPNHLILLIGDEDLELENVRTVDSVGDGFYLKSKNPTALTQDTRRVRLVDCSSENSLRHGISVVAAEDVQIQGGTYSKSNGSVLTDGTHYSTGIRIEPNPPSPLGTIHNVLVQGVTINNNEAAGIHIQEGPGVVVEDIRILGNTLSRNGRGHLLLRGRRFLVADNRFQEFTYDANISEVAGIIVRDGAQEIVVQDNVFSTFDPGPLDVISVEDEVSSFRASGNFFQDILLPSGPSDTSASAPTILRTSSPKSVITDNTFHTSDLRGILVSTSATSSVVSGNSFFGMDHNVIYVNGQDTVLSGNRIANPRGNAGSGKAEAVIRVRSDLGTAEGNAIACVNGTQRGYLFEKNPVIVADNVAKACNPNLWLTIEGTGTSHDSGNYLYP